MKLLYYPIFIFLNATSILYCPPNQKLLYHNYDRWADLVIHINDQINNRNYNIAPLPHQYNVQFPGNNYCSPKELIYRATSLRWILKQLRDSYSTRKEQVPTWIDAKIENCNTMIKKTKKIC